MKSMPVIFNGYNSVNAEVSLIVSLSQFAFADYIYYMYKNHTCHMHKFFIENFNFNFQNFHVRIAPQCFWPLPWTRVSRESSHYAVRGGSSSGPNLLSQSRLALRLCRRWSICSMGNRSGGRRQVATRKGNLLRDASLPCRLLGLPPSK